MKSRSATAFAPATVANVAVGFDILGFALAGLGEYATVRLIDKGVQMAPVEGYPGISLDPRLNTATAGLLELIRDRKLDHGFHVQLKKNIPVGSGLGGSSTSAVATIVAANALLRKKLKTEELLHYALIGEAVASGARHADNIAPCLLGGLVFVRSHPEIIFRKIQIPRSLRAVIILPELSIKTSDARRLLSETVPLGDVVKQTANLSGFLIGCMTGDMDLIGQSLVDEIIEPQRARLIPMFPRLQTVARESGALGCSISGSGPAIFALVRNQKDALRIQKKWSMEAEAMGLRLHGCWVSAIAQQGAVVRVGKRK